MEWSIAVAVLYVHVSPTRDEQLGGAGTRESGNKCAMCILHTLNIFCISSFNDTVDVWGFNVTHELYRMTNIRRFQYGVNAKGGSPKSNKKK